MLLKCEICGSTDFVKDNGVFICQNCGMKYTLAEVKKMISAACVEDNGEKPQEKEPTTLETAVIGPTVDDQFSDLEAAQNNIEEGNGSSRKKCPFCGAELFDDADEFCMMCGSKVAFSEETSTLPNNLDKNEPVCPKCGNPKYDENDDFCIYCGYAFGLYEDNDIADNSNIDKEPLEVVPLTDSLDSTTTICAACGQPLYDANDTFCIYCGARITERESDSPIDPMIVTPTSCETMDEAVVSDEEYNQTDTSIEMPVKEVMVPPEMVVITTEGVKSEENTTDNNSSLEEEIPQVDNSTAINDTEEKLVEETLLPPQEEISNKGLEDLTHTEETDNISNEILEKSIEDTDSKIDADEIKEEIEVTNAPNGIVSDVIGDDSLRVADISEVNVARIEETKYCEQTDPTDSESHTKDDAVSGLEKSSKTSNTTTDEVVPDVSRFSYSADEGKYDPTSDVSTSESRCESDEVIEAEISSNEAEIPTTDAKPGHDDQKVSGSKKMWLVIVVAALIVIVIVVAISLIPKRNDLDANEPLEIETVSNTIVQESFTQTFEQPTQKSEKDTEQNEQPSVISSKDSFESSFENVTETSKSVEESLTETESEASSSIEESESIKEETEATVENENPTETSKEEPTTVENSASQFASNEGETNSNGELLEGWIFNKELDQYCFYADGVPYVKETYLKEPDIPGKKTGWYYSEEYGHDCFYKNGHLFHSPYKGGLEYMQGYGGVILDDNIMVIKNCFCKDPETNGVSTFYAGPDGRFIENQWYKVNGTEYYFGQYGRLMTNYTAPDGRQTDENGALRQ